MIKHFNFKYSKLNYTSCQSLDCLFAKVSTQNMGGRKILKLNIILRTDFNLWQNSLLTSSYARFCMDFWFVHGIKVPFFLFNYSTLINIQSVAIFCFSASIPLVWGNVCVCVCDLKQFCQCIVSALMYNCSQHNLEQMQMNSRQNNPHSVHTYIFTLSYRSS